MQGKWSIIISGKLVAISWQKWQAIQVEHTLLWKIIGSHRHQFRVRLWTLIIHMEESQWVICSWEKQKLNLMVMSLDIRYQIRDPWLTRSNTRQNGIIAKQKGTHLLMSYTKHRRKTSLKVWLQIATKQTRPWIISNWETTRDSNGTRNQELHSLMWSSSERRVWRDQRTTNHRRKIKLKETIYWRREQGSRWTRLNLLLHNPLVLITMLNWRLDHLVRIKSLQVPTLIGINQIGSLCLMQQEGPKNHQDQQHTKVLTQVGQEWAHTKQTIPNTPFPRQSSKVSLMFILKRRQRYLVWVSTKTRSQS